MTPYRYIVFFIVALGWFGCGDSTVRDGDHGSVHVEVIASEALSAEFGLRFVQFYAVLASEPCTSVPIEPSIVPVISDPDTRKGFAEAVLLLEPGRYRMCSIPLIGRDPAVESPDCQMREGFSNVVSGQTAALTFQAQCGTARGAFEIALNRSEVAVNVRFVQFAVFDSNGEFVQAEVPAFTPDPFWATVLDPGDYRLAVTFLDQEKQQTSCLSLDLPFLVASEQTTSIDSAIVCSR